MPHTTSIAHGHPAREGSWITAPLLAAVPGLVHGFSTRPLGDQRPDTADRSWLGGLGMVELGLLRQVHGTAVVPADGATATTGERPEGDAWAGVAPPGRLLGILTADCLPVLLAHPASGRLAAIHAGWRGAVAGVVEAALAALQVPADEVLAALGPAIGPCCYQVGKEVAEAAGPGSHHLTPWPGSPDRCAFDLPGFVAARLRASGVPDERVAALARCTHCDAHRFFSHRRAAEPERMVAFVGWRSGVAR